MRGELPDWRGVRILVAGDLILDRFVYGTVHRISPEAPIPVVEVSSERALPGGAANVANNIAALGGAVTLVGAIGGDPIGRQFREVLAGAGLSTDALVEIPGRTTTVKTRIVAHHQQVVRVDREVRDPLDERARQRVLASIEAALPGCAALVVSDYAKGLFDHTSLAAIGEMAKAAGIPYVVDPKPSHFPYPGATVLTPNRAEAAGLCGHAFSLDQAGAEAEGLFSRTDWAAILFTVGEEGMVLARRKGAVEHIPARVREVYDVTGAGDTVVAVLSLALASGIPLSEAAHMANAAAGVVVGKVGTATCNPEELTRALADELP